MSTADARAARGRRRVGRIRRAWRWFRNLPSIRTALAPAGTLSLAFLTLGGFLMGVVFWGGFNTALEATNTDSLLRELPRDAQPTSTRNCRARSTSRNRSGVRAGCPDCHVPHEWTSKIARKMQASKEVWGHIFGSIATRDTFLDHAPTPGRERMGAHEGE